MSVVLAGFDWDDANRLKCQRHGVALVDIEAVFADVPRVVPDIHHSTAEDRFIAIGRATNNRPIFVAFTFRTVGGRRLIRPISARYMHAKEQQRYEAEGS
jgi:uncharacterized DUF497 family protein